MVMATNGDTIIVNSGTYLAPAIPVLSPNVTMIGVGRPTLKRTNAVGTNQCDGATAGPFVQPNDNFVMNGFNIVATNGIAGGVTMHPAYSNCDIAFGLDDVIPSKAVASYTNTTSATNWSCVNCAFTGQIYATYFDTYTGGTGLTNSGAFHGCTFNAGYDCMYMRDFSLGESFQNVQCYNCYYNAGTPTNLTENFYQGWAGCIHMNADTNHDYISDFGGIMTLFGTNTGQKVSFIFPEKSWGVINLANTQFLLASNMTTPLPHGYIEYNAGANPSLFSVFGSYIDTNYAYNVLYPNGNGGGLTNLNYLNIISAGTTNTTNFLGGAGARRGAVSNIPAYYANTLSGGMVVVTNLPSSRKLIIVGTNYFPQSFPYGYPPLISITALGTNLITSSTKTLIGSGAVQSNYFVLGFVTASSIVSTNKYGFSWTVTPQTNVFNTNGISGF